MSLRAEIVRLALRRMIKARTRSGITVAQGRQILAGAERWVPRPPTGVRVRAVNAGGVPGEEVTAPASRPDRRILYLHGGAYCAGSPRLYRDLSWRLAQAAEAVLLAPDYRLAPEHPFPAALDDAVAAYDGLLAEGGDPRRIALAGDSAGGGLVFALLLRLRDSGRPLPAAAVALSPWTDLALGGASLQLNARRDPMLDPRHLPPVVEWYLAGADPREPTASPVYGDCTGLPPALIQVGEDEILRDDAVRMTEQMHAGGAVATLEIWPRMPHVWHTFAPVLPEARRAVARIGAFLRPLL
ncbi:MAG TPA: alpha/beta hydrolase [Stellaceae bacterium]